MVHNHNIPEILYINIEKTEAPWGDMKKPSDSFRKSEGFMAIFSLVLGLHGGEKLTETTSGLRTAKKFAIYKKGGSQRVSFYHMMFRQIIIFTLWKLSSVRISFVRRCYSE